MPEKVSYDTIDMKVVLDWCRLMEETAEERGQKLWSVQPFFPFQQTYMEVNEEVRNKTYQGLEFYRKMVRQLPGYDFEKKLD